MKRPGLFLAIAGCFASCAACSDVPKSGAVIMGELSGFAPDERILKKVVTLTVRQIGI